MKKRNLLIVSILCLLAILGSFLVACDQGTTHKHTAGTEWKSNATHHWHECTAEDCDDKDAQIDKAEHTFGEWSEVVDGKKTRECTVCHYKEEQTEAGPQPGQKCEGDNHIGLPTDDSGWDVKTPGNCTQKAVLTATCTSCNKEVTKEGALDPDKHVYVDDGEYGWQPDKDHPLTCVSGGKSVRFCSLCHEDSTRQDKESSEPDTVNGHNYKKGKQVSAATCEDYAVYTYTCSLCKEGTKNHTINKEDPAEGYNKLNHKIDLQSAASINNREHEIAYICKDLSGEKEIRPHTYDGLGLTCRECDFKVENRKDVNYSEVVWGNEVSYNYGAAVKQKNKNDEFFIIPRIEEEKNEQGTEIINKYRVNEIRLHVGAKIVHDLTTSKGIVIPWTIEKFSTYAVTKVFEILPSCILKIYYEGTEEELKAIEGYDKSGLDGQKDKVVYYSETEDNGKWHWNNGKPAIWGESTEPGTNPGTDTDPQNPANPDPETPAEDDYDIGTVPDHDYTQELKFGTSGSAYGVKGNETMMNLQNSGKTFNIIIIPAKYKANNNVYRDVSIIEGNSFAYLTGLESVVIPNSVKEIKSNAFIGLNNLKIYYEGNPKSWREIKIDKNGNDAIKEENVIFYCGTQREGCWHWNEEKNAPTLWNESQSIVALNGINKNLNTGYMITDLKIRQHMKQEFLEI